MNQRYETLDVTVNLDSSTVKNTHPNKFSTVDFAESSQLSAVAQNDQRVNKFRQLYFKNEKLRKQLKLLNVKLNEKLEKVKLMPSKNKKAMSVDLNVQKPTKALQRQLQNAYNQISMYKKQISQLKVKQQSQSTYEKYKALQNQISFRDISITQIEQQLKSIKNVKKMQQKTLIQEVQNDQLKDKMQQYERQFKQGQQKLKDISKKARKRQQQYKKQQAYQVALQTKLRKLISNEVQKEQPQPQTNTNANNPVAKQQFDQKEIQLLKQQIQKYKVEHTLIQKRIQLQKKTLRDLKKNKKQCEEKYTNFDIEVKNLMLKIQSYCRLIKDHQKKTDLTGYNSLERNSKQTTLLGLKEVYLQSQDPQDEEIQLNFDKKSNLFEAFQSPKTVNDQRLWKGKPRKVTFGFMDSNDSLHKISGIFRGIKVWIDENKIICGIGFIYRENSTDMQSGVIGTRTSNQLLWILHANDKLASIEGSLTQQGYLSNLMLMSKQGLFNRFGNLTGVEKFNCKIETNQEVTGFYCAVRKLGNDTRITQLGFWITKNQ